MSQGKIWAKIVDNEIMQFHDEDPSGLWHPDHIEKNDLPGHWEQVPDHVGIGWKFKKDKWISGGQWGEEFRAENPLPPPGPPSARIDFSMQIDNEKHIATVTFDCYASGHVDTWDAIVDGKVYKDPQFVVEFEQTDKPRPIEMRIVAVGPGGEFEEIPGEEDADRKLVIPEKWEPIFLKAFKAGGGA